MRGTLVGNRRDNAAPSVLDILDEVCEIYEDEYRCANMGINCKSK